jgi:prepilin-type N-terminal cleavage/methylation domain-containing protein
MRKLRNKHTGFTIVELLIVIVVIAILATVSIVAYSGVQDRARYTKALSDLQTINKSIRMYQAQNGTFPVTAGWRYYCTYQSNPTSFIPGLDEVLKNVPAAPCSVGTNTDDTWLYRSDGVGYKLIYLRANVSDGYRNLIPAEMRDTRWTAGTSWGYWTDDHKAL